MSPSLIWNKVRTLGLLLMVVCCLFIASAAAQPPTTATLDMGKSFSFQGMNISTIKSVNFLNHSQATIILESTLGDDSDVKEIEMPEFRYAYENIMTQTGNFSGTTIDVNKSSLTKLDWSDQPPYAVYTKPVIPTLNVSVPDTEGNVFVFRYDLNQSKDAMLGPTLFQAASAFYLYSDDGIAYLNNNKTLSAWGAIQVDSQNLANTLNENEVSLDSFISDSDAAQNLGEKYPCTLPSIGYYIAAAIRQDNPLETLYVYDALPVIILENDTEMIWDGEMPGTYDQSSGKDVVVSFSPNNTDTAALKDVVYLLIKKDERYDINITTHQLADSMQQEWNRMNETSRVFDLVKWIVTRDVGQGKAITYTLDAVDGPSATPSEEWYDVAISPGYGISGFAIDDRVAIPATDLQSLQEGDYYVYALGLNDIDEIIALDQSEVRIEAGNDSSSSPVEA